MAVAVAAGVSVGIGIGTGVETSVGVDGAPQLASNNAVKTSQRIVLILLTPNAIVVGIEVVPVGLKHGKVAE